MKLMSKLKILVPSQWGVYQRSEDKQTQIPFIARFAFLSSWKNAKVKARWVERTYNDSQKKGTWQIVADPPSSRCIHSCISVPVGNFDILVRIDLRGKKRRKKNFQTVENVGIGEIFVMVGQSNAANSGTARLRPKHNEVRAMTKKGWQIADDPQPFASNTKGSPWTVMGDILFEQLNIPIGVISAAVGGSSVAEWQEDNNNYQNFIRLLNKLRERGCKKSQLPRAILWHQGETDSRDELPAEQYVTLLKKLIENTSRDICKESQSIPWIVALAAFHTDTSQTAIDAIISAQKQVIMDEELDYVYKGPTTEDLLGLDWRAPDLVHFNKNGLKEHGRRWAQTIMKIFFMNDINY
ncbi:MAG: hypothetical protein GF364_01045 [Candidatus Lokiarchaeota archaeon]|nr:hypothetical protein [Candidatus Lokiarchaeota archaeon]